MLPDVTVFVVDDDDQARESVGALIRSMGLEAECFSSGEAFLESYAEDRPGCLVTDLRMLGMSGLELQETLIERRIHSAGNRDHSPPTYVTDRSCDASRSDHVAREAL